MRLPPFADGPRTLEFHRELHREHLDAAAFLHQHRQGLAHDADVTWLDVGEWEERLEAHIDALVVGGEPALETCRVASEEGDAGELFAAVSLFCRRGRRDLVGGVLRRLDPEDAEKAHAVSDALNAEMPSEWADALANGVARGFDKLVPAFARYAGYRRFAADGALDALIERVPAHGLAQIIWALGRLGGPQIRSQVAAFVEHHDPEIRQQAMIAMLRQGDVGALASCRHRAVHGDPAMCLPLAVSGGRSDATFLRHRLVTSAVTSEGLLALGILGELACVPVLMHCLSDDELAAAAATALHLVTGAGLREDVFVPEAVEEDELFAEEQEAYRATGEVPQHADGRPFGESILRLSRHAGQWDDWLNQHQADFEPSQRYRLGKPFTPRSLVDTLAAASFGRLIRTLAYEELVIRYGIDARFETDMRVDEQKSQINAISRLCRSREQVFQVGRWYFAGGLS